MSYPTENISTKQTSVEKVGHLRIYKALWDVIRERKMAAGISEAEYRALCLKHASAVWSQSEDDRESVSKSLLCERYPKAITTEDELMVHIKTTIPTPQMLERIFIGGERFGNRYLHHRLVLTLLEERHAFFSDEIELYKKLIQEHRSYFIETFVDDTAEIAPYLAVIDGHGPYSYNMGAHP